MHPRDVRVLSIPAQHPYAQAIRPEGVAYLPDPDIDGHWWPHPALEAAFWDSPRDVDIVHIHFGFEHLSPDQVRELVVALPVPLVVTVHDLDNPHLSEQTDHHERLRILVAAASAVLTLTPSAAERLRAEFGAGEVRVVPHPAITRDRPGVPRDAVAGVFVKSLRANVVADPAFYLGVARRVPLRVYAHDVEATAGLRRALEAAGGVELVTHAPLDDTVLHREVARLSACILPYARGTHSGWLEMCRDLGTPVVVPDAGCYADQADDPRAVATYAPGDAASAASAAAALLRRGPVPYAGDRDAQLREVRAAHAETYREVLGL